MKRYHGESWRDLTKNRYLVNEKRKIEDDNDLKISIKQELETVPSKVAERKSSIGLANSKILLPLEDSDSSLLKIKEPIPL
jgi:hypothetical protein